MAGVPTKAKAEGKGSKSEEISLGSEKSSKIEDDDNHSISSHSSESGSSISEESYSGHSEYSESQDEMSTMYRRFTDQLIETMRLMGAP